MQLDIKDKSTIINVLFIIVLFYVVTTTISLFSQSITLFSFVVKHDADLATQQILMVAAAMVSVIGLGVFVAMFFSKKISERTFIIVQALTALILVILFVISVMDDVYPNVTALQQAVNFAILLGIYVYRFRNKESKPVNKPEAVETEEMK